MSFPRTTDVAKHLERKFSHAKLQTRIIPITDAPTTDLHLLPVRSTPAAAIAHPALKPDTIR
jgi:hypothetical protein